MFKDTIQAFYSKLNITLWNCWCLKTLQACYSKLNITLRNCWCLKALQACYNKSITVWNGWCLSKCFVLKIKGMVLLIMSPNMMPLQRKTVNKWFFKEWTWERLFTCVSAHMNLHVITFCKQSIAQETWEWPLASVYKHMSRQILLLTEHRNSLVYRANR